ncbi:MULTISPECIES: DUF6228 family protein [unclassified Streptomyces]|uniref:DUF6228 family protein n=1 Tax=unclassified Streptomyces TaxID=2593676 RepID=UPI00074A4B4E|nr:MULTISPECIES: DUF6228 family protein [unclassified Streptomyces]KUL58362.1 hypothetical protein ADL30_11045 [Streptomyces sp. NRRL S-1521]THC44069.1 hypothetical protein E7X58_33790 [Streptomyces sp. A1499]
MAVGGQVERAANPPPTTGGWDGGRSRWNHDRDPAVSADFRPGGRVGPTWAVRPWPRDAGSRGASVTAWLEAGEQMTALAADVRALLAEGHR